MATLADWKAELNGGSNLDKSDFANFIPRHNPGTFLVEAFAGLPKGNELIRRIEQLLNENDNSKPYVVPKKENRLPEAQLIPFLEQYRRSIQSFLASRGREDVASYLSNDRVRIVYSNDGFLDIIRANADESAEVEEAVGDIFNRQLRNLGDYAYALKEAVLSLTKYPGITRYVMEGTVNINLRHLPYYELWRGGGDVYFFEDHSLMLCEYGS